MSLQDSSDLAKLYDSDYHAERLEEDSGSAAVVIPLLLELFPSVTSAVDVGCSTGAWLHELRTNGISRVLGLVGASASLSLPRVDAAEIRWVDFRRPFPQLGRFDLAISLEVANCLSQNSAQRFVANLVGVSDLIVFSAAVPGQSLQPSVNERWPSYWIGLFAANQFTCLDILRERLWYDQRVSWKHSQNMLVFAHRDRKDLVDRLELSARRVSAVDIVHPRAFEFFRSEVWISSATSLKLFPFELVEVNYNGYNILRVDVDKFLALGLTEGPYVPAKLAAGGYEHAYLAESVEHLKAKILRASVPIKRTLWTKAKRLSKSICKMFHPH